MDTRSRHLPNAPKQTDEPTNTHKSHLEIGVWVFREASFPQIAPTLRHRQTFGLEELPPAKLGETEGPFFMHPPTQPKVADLWLPQAFLLPGFVEEFFGRLAMKLSNLAGRGCSTHVRPEPKAPAQAQMPTGRALAPWDSYDYGETIFKKGSVFEV